VGDDPRLGEIEERVERQFTAVPGVTGVDTGGVLRW
jgi:hypothetical protein